MRDFSLRGSCAADVNHSGFDRITVDQLRFRGSKKWSGYPAAIGAWVAEMDFGLAPEIGNALLDAIQHDRTGYLTSAAQDNLARTCSRWQKDAYGWEIDAEDVRPIPDVLNALEMTIRHFSSPDSAVIVPTPAYTPFLELPRYLGRRVIQVPMQSDGGVWNLDSDELDRAFLDGGEVLILCNPHNPTGKVHTQGELLLIADVVERRGGRVFSDEIHAPIVYPGEHTHVPYASINEITASHTITAVSAAKGWNISGLKCAQVILSNDRDRQQWREVGFFAEHGASIFGAIASATAYEACGAWLDGVLSYVDKNRREMSDLIAHNLPGAIYHPPRGTYVAWLDCRALGLGDHPSAFFLDQADVACTDGALCGDGWAGHLRFNMAMPRPILRDALARMGRAVEASGLREK